MTQEEKAKRYDEILEQLKGLIEGIREDKRAIMEEDIIDIFPELQESEDEKIRKIISGLIYTRPACFFDNGISKEEMLNWLKKQGNKPQGKTALKAIKKEKIDNTNKVEPKFHEGEWVVWDNKITCHIDDICQGKESLMYTITDTHNMTRTYSVKDFDKNAHLWTIQDTKDGDVLVYNNSLVEIILLFEKWKHGIVGGAVYSHAHTFNNKILFNDWSDCGYTAHPATEKQRDFLFKKMRESGYEWDAEKKELRKIKQISKWTEEDESKVEDIIYFLNTAKTHYASTKALDDCIDWLESLKQRML